MIKEFISALGLERIIKDKFKTTDTAIHRDHKDHENLLQMIYQIFGTYYEDNYADEIRKAKAPYARLQYINLLRRLVLPGEMRKHLIDTVRLKLLKVATKVVHSGRYIKFNLCSSCP